MFVIAGLLAALSAFILASRLNSGQPNAGLGFELQVIAAVILGGISLTGGVGTSGRGPHWDTYSHRAQ